MSPDATTSPAAPEPGGSADDLPARFASANESVAALRQLALRARRQDLTERVEAVERTFRDAGCTVVIVGEFKAGKSSLVNALVNAPACPVRDDVATALPTEIWHGSEADIRVLLRGTEEDEAWEARQISAAEIESYVLEPPSAPDADRAHSIRISLPRKLLAGGLRLVDTPGIGGTASSHSAAALNALTAADAVLFVTSAAQELTAHELEFLSMARGICPQLGVVETKVDFYPGWRKIIDIDRGHLRAAGIECPIFPTSASLRRFAIEGNDAELNEESGYKALIHHLRSDLVAGAQRRALRSLHADLESVLVDYRAQLDAEVVVIEDPDRRAALLADLARARTTAEERHSRAAKWQQTLTDGITDLTADIEHDLRGRLRATGREAEQSIDAMDPRRGWDELALWLKDRTTFDVMHNYADLHDRAAALADDVAAHFNGTAADLGTVFELTEASAVRAVPALDDDAPGAKKRLFASPMNAMRGAAGGVVMVSLLGTLVPGFAPSVVALGAAGALFGRKQMKEDRERGLSQARLQAKQTARRFTDDVTFEATHAVRDTLRVVQRNLRDHYLQQAEQLTAANRESLEAAERAVQGNDQQRVERKAAIGELLAEVDAAAAKVSRVVAGRE